MDGLARDREVILFDTQGSPALPARSRPRFEADGANAVAFSRALGLNKADSSAFSIGAWFAQEISLQAPISSDKLIVVGTGPRGLVRAWAALTPGAKADLGPPMIPPPSQPPWIAVPSSVRRGGPGRPEKGFLKAQASFAGGAAIPEVKDKVSPPLAQVESDGTNGRPEKGSLRYLRPSKRQHRRERQ